MAQKASVACLLILIVFYLGLAPNAEADQCEDCLVGCGSGGAVSEYFQYVNDTICSDDDQLDCLEPTSYIATRSDGRQVRVNGVYRWRSVNAIWQDSDFVLRFHLLPHFILDYMRLLRNAYAACPGFHLQLYNQIDYLVSQGTIRDSPNTVLPVLVWENRYGIAQGMEQGEMAAFLASAAGVYKTHGAKEARSTMRYAFQAMESLWAYVGVHTGGVRSHNQDLCGAKKMRFRECFWFHSYGVGVNPYGQDIIGTVLNQHLHVIYDMLDMYKTVSENQDLIPEKYHDAKWHYGLDRIEDRAIGGLYQLVFSNGNKRSAPDRPPNIAQFMNQKDASYGMKYYWSWYRFDMDIRQFVDITFYHTCNYHTHVLKKSADIRKILEKNHDLFANTPSNEGWRLYEAMERLFHTDYEGLGHPSQNAIYQFWLSQIYKYTEGFMNCPPCEKKECEQDERVEEYYNTHNFFQ